MARITVRTFGTVKIEVGDRSLGPSAGQLFAALFYLASRGDHPTARGLLGEMLLPQTNENQPGHNLRQLIYRLRQLGVRLNTDADGVKLAEDVRLDWLEMLQRKELGAADFELIARGFCPGYTPDVSEAYREWYEAERSSVQLRLSRAVGLQLTQLRHAGRWDLVEVGARAMLALDPFNEKGMTSRAEALAASGSTMAALRVIDEYVDELGEDQANLRLRPMALRRRISEQMPDIGHRSQEDRIFVGREDAMRMLSAAGAAARRGTQQTVLVWGEPGIGKTRLLAEYKALAALEGALTVQATCQPHDVFRPLGIVSDLVAQLLEAPGSLGCDPHGRELLMRLVTASRAASASQHQYARASLSAIIRALDDLVDAIGTETTLLLLIDDAQWLDRLSIKTLMSAFATRAPRHAQLTFASRHRALLANHADLAESVTSLRLQPLERDASLKLVRSLLPQDGTLGEGYIEERILEQCRGNPLLIRQLSLDYARSADASALLQTTSKIFERRLEQLSVISIRTLEACVVLGKNCSYPRLEQLLGLTRFSLLRAIEELDDCGLIDVRDGCFVCGHALIARAVSKQMSTSVHRALHSAAAELLIRDFTPGQAGSLPWDCAEHWRVAAHPEKAVTVLRDCARRALEIGRPDDALAIVKRALELEACDDVRLGLVEEALRLLCLSIDRRDTTALIKERTRLRKNLNRPVLAHDEFEITAAAGDYHTDKDPTENILQLRSCVQASDASPTHRLEAARQLLMIAELTLDGDLARFAYESTRNDFSTPSGRLMADLLFHIWFGDEQRARESADALAALDLAESPQRLPLLLNAGYAQYRVGRSEDAERTLLKGLEIAQECGIVSGQMNAYLFLARLYWSTAQLRRCKHCLEEFESVFAKNPDPGVVGEVSVLGAHIAISEQRLDSAEALLQRARSCNQSRLPLPRLFIMACFIRLQTARGDAPCSESELQDLLTLHLKARGVGCQDDVMIAVVSALVWFERHQEAGALLSQYLHEFRRDGFAPPYELKLLARELPNNIDRTTLYVRRDSVPAAVATMHRASASDTSTGN